jgi:hypothetical protein
MLNTHARLGCKFVDLDALEEVRRNAIPQSTEEKVRIAARIQKAVLHNTSS